MELLPLSRISDSRSRGLFLKAAFNILGGIKVSMDCVHLQPQPHVAQTSLHQAGGFPLLVVSRFLVGMAGAGTIMTL